MEVLGILVLATAIYFLPAIIAHSRRAKNTSAILVLNLLAGWTIIGWIVAMVWAHVKDDKK